MLGLARVDKMSDQSEVCVVPEGEVELPSHDFGLRVDLGDVLVGDGEEAARTATPTPNACTHRRS